MVKSLSSLLESNRDFESKLFIVEEDDGGGYTAQALGESIFTQGDSLEELKEMVKDAVECHFEDDKPHVIRLHIVRQEILTL